MRSASASLKRIGLTFLWAAMLGTIPGVAKSAPGAASASSDGTSPAEESAQTVPVTEQPSSDKPAPRETAADPGPDGEIAAAADGSEDGWTLDEETGRRYKVEKVPKVKGAYIWRDENHIRLPGGLMRVEVVKHDEKWFWIKIWEVKLRSGRRPPPKEPSQEELDQVAATYVPDSGASDRIRLVPFDQGLPRSGQWRQGFDVADMNGDGHLDVVFGPSRKGRPLPNIFLGDGQGRWRHWSEARYPRMPYDYGDAAAADFNGDGHMDVAFGFHLRGMLVLVGDGQGGFELWTQGLDLEVAGGDGSKAFSSRAIEAVDWNRDGRLDLLALGEGPKGIRFSPGKASGTMVNTARSMVLFVNQGDGSWLREPADDRSGDYGDDFALGDFDRDGRPDVAIASRRRGSREFLRISSTGEQGRLAAQQLAPLRPNASLASVAAADLDGDGFDELLLAYLSHELGVWRTGIDLYSGDPETGWERRTVTSEASRAGVWDMAVGELDGDGAPDLVGLTGFGQTWVFLGDGQGGFEREASPELPPLIKGCEGSEVRLVDLDGDGRDEILSSFAGEPTGPVGMPGVISFPGCPGQGRIYAWRVDPAPEAAPAAGSSDHLR